MATVQELLQEREALDRRIAEQQAAERSAVLDEFRALLTKHGMTIQDVVKGLASGKPKTPASTAGKKVAVKYRDPESGQTWTGRGLRPKWLREKIDAGGKLESFLVP